MISGKTTLIAHVGHPTHSFKAPLIYNPWFDRKGIDAVVMPMGVRVDVDRIAPGTFVGEVVMAREITPFLRAAQEKGCPIQVGKDMLFEQIPAYLEFFGFGTATPDELRAVSQIKD